MHTFIWRNWNLVGTSRIAMVLETSEDNVRAVARSMGLPAEDRVTPQQKDRLYLTIIRRNWHLLPYDQLLILLDMSPGQLATTLREDDFLWAKLGNLKPRCDRLTYALPGPEASARATEIRQFVEREFGREMNKAAEPPLSFVKEMTAPLTGPPRPNADSSSGIRYLYSYFAVYGDPLLDPKLDPYPDGLLQRLADIGVNGVWLHVVLRDLAPSEIFPEFGQDHEKRLENLRKLVERAKRLGVSIYLYMNEPRAMPRAFFKDRPDFAGVSEGEYVTLCTSNPLVRKWLGDTLAYVFSNVPDLGGVFTITASENLTHCASHFNQKSCPRCKDRAAAAIVAELNSTIEAGVHRGNPKARIIAWDWGWADGWAQQIIPQLPKSVALQSVSEWSLPVSRGGVATTVGEYSISSVGPGPRAKRHWELARMAGLSCIAKVQMNNSWELSAVPFLPVLDLVAEHCENLNAAGVDGMMLGWTLGGYPSPNLQVVNQLSRRPAPSREDALNAVAAQHFGPSGAPHARKAWTLFSTAFREYPFNGSVVYNAPIQLGPANLLYGKPTGYAATMVGFPYDDVNGWRGPYPAEVLASQYAKVASGWRDGLTELERAAVAAPRELVAEARRDLGVARAAQIHFQSVANQVRFVLARDAAAKETRSEQRTARIMEMRTLVEDEARLARELFSLARQDSRIGFEASNQYYYVSQDLIEKALCCDQIRRSLR